MLSRSKTELAPRGLEEAMIEIQNGTSSSSFGNPFSKHKILSIKGVDGEVNTFCKVCGKFDWKIEQLILSNLDDCTEDFGDWKKGVDFEHLSLNPVIEYDYRCINTPRKNHDFIKINSPSCQDVVVEWCTYCGRFKNLCKNTFQCSGNPDTQYWPELQDLEHHHFVIIERKTNDPKKPILRYTRCIHCKLLGSIEGEQKPDFLFLPGKGDVDKSLCRLHPKNEIFKEIIENYEEDSLESVLLY